MIFRCDAADILRADYDAAPPQDARARCRALLFDAGFAMLTSLPMLTFTIRCRLFHERRYGVDYARSARHEMRCRAALQQRACAARMPGALLILAFIIFRYYAMLALPDAADCRHT